MRVAKNKSLLSGFRSGYLGKLLFILVTLNFINLCVNFSEKKQELEDPVDTISEMVFEWGMEGDSDIIPDNGTEQEDQNLKTLKLICSPDFFITWIIGSPILIQKPSDKTDLLPSIFLSRGTPPPDVC